MVNTVMRELTVLVDTFEDYDLCEIINRWALIHLSDLHYSRMVDVISMDVVLRRHQPKPDDVDLTDDFFELVTDAERLLLTNVQAYLCGEFYRQGDTWEDMQTHAATVFRDERWSAILDTVDPVSFLPPSTSPGVHLNTQTCSVILYCCNHVVCKSCIATYMVHDKLCPMCRSALLPPFFYT